MPASIVVLSILLAVAFTAAALSKMAPAAVLGVISAVTAGLYLAH